MNVGIIGAGNVGGLLAARIIDASLADVTLVDIKENIAQAKAQDISDSLALSQSSCHIQASSDFNLLKNSQIVVITAGFPRKPGMTREELISKNANLIKEISGQVSSFIKNKIVIIVTNPLDLMTYYFKKLTGINPKQLIGMGSSLDSSRFANIIASKLGKAIKDIKPCVIGSHGTDMLPLERLTSIKDKPLAEVAPKEEIENLKKLTVERGAEIVSLYENGSAYFAPSLATFQIVRAIIKDEKKTLYACAYLEGAYGLSGLCLGVPLKIGKNGIEEIIILSLSTSERAILQQAADALKVLMTKLPA
jgi:malate dehydrogenase